jgi:hypothetical protein
VLYRHAGTSEQIQEVLDAGESKDWQLVGVFDVPGSDAETPSAGSSGERRAKGRGGRSVILFWDTQRPSFARSTG